MLQIISISQARSNLSQLVKKVQESKQSVVIVQDSNPVVMISPYNKSAKKEDYLSKLLTIKGDWFSEDEALSSRSEVEKRLATYSK